ncbi:MAG: transcriptional regulator [Pyrinomonadaceae bacterium]
MSVRMGEQRQHCLYEFGPFCVDTRERVLLRDGKPVPLKPKVYETLLALVKKSGHVVDKEALMRDVWPDAFVEQDNLTANIFRARPYFSEGSKG